MGNQVTYFNKLPTDVGVGMFEYQNTAGNVWCISTGLITITSPNYYILQFTTPDKGYTVIAQYEIEKSGDELLLQIAGDASTTGASAITNIFNMNRNETKTNPFVVVGGSYPTVSFTSSTLGGDTLIPGTSLGVNRTTSVQASGQILVLKNSFTYAMKISAIGNSTKFTLRVFLGNIL